MQAFARACCSQCRATQTTLRRYATAAAESSAATQAAIASTSTAAARLFETTADKQRPAKNRRQTLVVRRRMQPKESLVDMLKAQGGEGETEKKKPSSFIRKNRQSTRSQTSSQKKNHAEKSGLVAKIDVSDYGGFGNTGPIGQDLLKPTSESGWPDTARIDSTTFRQGLSDEDVVAKMKQVMQPLIKNCLKSAGEERDAELKRLRELLRNAVQVYTSIRQASKKDKYTQKFLLKVAENKWNNQNIEVAPTEATSATAADPAPAPMKAHGRRRRRMPHRQISNELRQRESTTGLSSQDVQIEKVKPLHDAPVAKLAHGLERILFNRGVQWLQDPRSGVYNYTKDVQEVIPRELFDFESLPRFVKPSEDADLRELCRKTGKKFAGSTSSLTTALSQIYFALNGNKDLNIKLPNFEDQLASFAPGALLPASIRLTYTKDGTYMIDSDKSVDINATESILSQLGHVLEKFLTHEPDSFSRYRKDTTNPFAAHESRDKREAYYYSGTEHLLMRSQLDCHDDRLPKKTFDIKTRATAAIRKDMINYPYNTGYQITQFEGEFESFEREKYDLIRSAFLKYSMQARIGDMDGIFLAYHSTDRIYGFEYLSLEEIDKFISGSHEESKQAFKLCVGLLEMALLRATQDIPKQSLRLTFDGFNSALQVFAAPDGDDEASPLKLYDIQLTSYLDDQEQSSETGIDFASFESKDGAEPTWTVTYDIATSNDRRFNIERLKAVRERQNIFNKKVILPEGLTKEQVDHAIKGLHNNPKREEVTANASEPKGDEASRLKVPEGSKPVFVPQPGVSYVARPYGLVPVFRKLAREGRQRLMRAANMASRLGKAKRKREKKDK